MCKQRVALNMIRGQNKRCGLSKAALILHEEQCKDFEMMQKQIDDIRRDITQVKLDLSEVKNTLYRIEGKKTNLLDNRVIQVVIITLVTTIAGCSNYIPQIMEFFTK